MRILIFGAGVIGSLYGAMLAEAGYARLAAVSSGYGRADRRRIL